MYGYKYNDYMRNVCCVVNAVLMNHKIDILSNYDSQTNPSFVETNYNF